MEISKSENNMKFSDEAIIDIARERPISLIDLCNIFPHIDKTRIAHRIESLKKSKHLKKVTTIPISYYEA